MASNLARKASPEPDPGTRPANKRLRPAVSVVRAQDQRRRASVRFFALDASLRVCIEADSEGDARSLCREMRWDFISLCQD